MKNKQFIFNVAILVAVALVCTAAGIDFMRMHVPEQIVTTNPNIAETKMLSDYSPTLKGTEADTAIFVLKGEKPGGSMLILGGTHPNETAGVLSAVTYVENARVEAGTVYIIPHTNSSGFTHTAPTRGQMDICSFTLEDGSTREFRMGTRLTNPVHQWPDPNYYDGKSGRELKYGETPEIRNLNRSHPGDPNGTLTERISYGLYKLITEEKIDVTYDAHEAGPEFLRVNYMIAHERAMPVGSMAVMNANLAGLPVQIDLSGKDSFGLSHRSLGDNTDSLMTLFETLNPAMGTMHGKVTEDLVLNGISDNYVKATKMGRLSSGELTEEGSPMSKRTAFHMVMCRELAVSFSEANPDKPITITGMPSYDDYINKGIGGILLPLNS